jgi:hypothetical protein
MTRSEGRLELGTEAHPVPKFLRLDEYSDFRRNAIFSPFDDDELSAEERLAKLLRPLIARNLNLSDAKQIKAFALPADRVRLFVYAPMPESFFVTNERFSRQSGYVLYCIDVVVRVEG